MRNRIIIFSLAICFALSGEVYAQRTLPGMKGIQVTGGMVDGFHDWNWKHTSQTASYCF